MNAIGMPTTVQVRFMSLSGPFKCEREETFADMRTAREAIEKHAASGGYTNVKEVDNADDDVRFTARTPGGRSGRNIAFACEDYGDFR